MIGRIFAAVRQPRFYLPLILVGQGITLTGSFWLYSETAQSNRVQDCEARLEGREGMRGVLFFVLDLNTDNPSPGEIAVRDYIDRELPALDCDEDGDPTVLIPSPPPTAGPTTTSPVPTSVAVGVEGAAAAPVGDEACMLSNPIDGVCLTVPLVGRYAIVAPELTVPVPFPPAPDDVPVVPPVTITVPPVPTATVPATTLPDITVPTVPPTTLPETIPTVTLPETIPTVSLTTFSDTTPPETVPILPLRKEHQWRRSSPTSSPFSPSSARWPWWCRPH